MNTWDKMLEEAEAIVEKDAFMKQILDIAIFRHSNFSAAVSCCLANQFSCAISDAQWNELFLSVYGPDPTSGEETIYHPGMPSLSEMGQRDLEAIIQRDPASDCHVTAFLHFKGYKALQAHRIAHVLWLRGRKDLARTIQSKCSQIFGVDIHPAAVIGVGLMMDHGSGIVIGETAVVGENCSFLHGVTLGSTGKDTGDRHPKIGNWVLIGCNATVLGNISVGDSCKIGSGSIVTKALPCGSTAVGNPARIVGRSKCAKAAAGMDVALLHVETPGGDDFSQTWSLTADGSSVFDEVDVDRRGKINAAQVSAALTLRFHISPEQSVVDKVFRQVDTDGDGWVDKTEFERISVLHLTCDLKGDLGSEQGGRAGRRLFYELSCLLATASYEGSSL